MRYLARFHDRNELARMRALLRSKGVPTWATTVESRRLGWQGTLHVCVDEQLDDALRLLRDPDHEPAHPVDAEAFERAMTEGDGTDLLLRTMHRALLWLLAIVAATALVVLAWTHLG
ncbi:MAG: hypothetical protein ACTHOH_17380 [Lysobacteraceae bacterium]